MTNIKKNSIAEKNIKASISHTEQLRALQLESEQYSLKIKKQEFENKEILNKWSQLLKEKDYLIKKRREEELIYQQEMRREKEREAFKQANRIDFDKSPTLRWVNEKLNSSTGSQLTNVAISALTGGLINPVIANTLHMHKLVEYSIRGITGLANLTKGEKWESRKNSALKKEQENTPTFRKLDDIYKAVMGISARKNDPIEKKKNTGLSDFLTSLGTIGKLLLAAVAGFGTMAMLNSDGIGSKVKDFLAGAIPGLVFGGIPGAILGGLFTLGAGELTEWWNDFAKKAGLNLELDKNLTRSVLSGAITGLGLGGIHGALLGAAIGSIGYLIFGKPKEFETEAQKEAFENSRITAGIIAGAALGLKFGGIRGAFVGALIGGAGAFFWNAMDEFQRDPTEENLKKFQETANETKINTRLGLMVPPALKANKTPKVNGQRINLRVVPKVTPTSPVFKNTAGMDVTDLGKYKYNPNTGRWHTSNGKIVPFNDVNRYLTKAKYGSKAFSALSYTIDPALTFLEYSQNKEYYEQMGIKDRERTRAIAGTGARTVGGWAGATAGAKVGAATGAAIGSIFPGAGTAIGAAIGGFVGAIGGGWAGATVADKATNAVVDNIYADNTNQTTTPTNPALYHGLFGTTDYDNFDYGASLGFGVSKPQSSSLLFKANQEYLTDMLNGEGTNSYKSLLVQEEMRDFLSEIVDNQREEKDTLKEYTDKNNNFVEEWAKLKQNSSGTPTFTQTIGGGNTI